MRPTFFVCKNKLFGMAWSCAKRSYGSEEEMVMNNYVRMVQKVNMWRVLDAEEIFCRVIVKGLASDKECLNWFLLSDYYDICERACVKVINDVKANIRGLGIKDAHRKILIQEEVITEIIVRQYYKE